MQTVSSDFLELVKGSTSPVFTADVWYDGNLVFENVRIIDGSVDFDSAQAVRGTLKLRIADPNNEMVPTSQGSALAPFGGYINVRAGFTWNGQAETVSLGWFDIQETTVDAAYKSYALPDGSSRQVPGGAVITVSCADFMKRVQDYPFLSPDTAITNSSTNLVINPGLDIDDSGWSGDFGTSGNGKLTRFTKQAFSGGVSGRMTWEGASTASATGGVSYTLQSGIIAGTTYTYSVVVRSSRPVTIAAQIVWKNSAGGTISTTTATSVSLAKNQWKKLIVTGIAPALATQASLNAVKTSYAVSTITYVKGTSGVVTATTSAAHGFSVGDQVIIAGVNPTGYNGTKKVTAVKSPTIFQFADTTTGTYVSGGTASSDFWWEQSTFDFDNAQMIAASAPSSWTVWDEIERLVGDVVSTIDPPFDTPQVPAGIVYDDNRFDTVAKLAKLANAEPVMNADGQLTLELLTGGDLAPDIDFNVNLLEYTRTLSRSNVYNIVVASGKGANSLTIRRAAQTVSGPLAVDGPFGRKPTFYDSDLLTTTQAVQSKADDLLSDVATASNQEIPVTILPNPAIELNDFVNLITETGTIKGRIVRFSYPSQGAMQVTVSVPNFWWAS
jgi:hypothetical protein